ncbi:peptide/nickel transport system permease protein [Actinacidiphila alni]|uniref:Peptide/nickel transport system permease protein n=1 Tax=Actinacidiphila alni TaxID=380248 RepID=A0A1I2IAX1_9ACTN|nr:ABC transporter permease [Actinacidiphila alni]SFF39509.1 peptide/nickel transport system permease protein [Actinacidiphila alni]
MTETALADAALAERELSRVPVAHRTPTRMLLIAGPFVIVLLLAVVAPLLAPQSPYEQHLDAISLPPGGGHRLGTDSLGRDVLSRVLYGGRPPALIGIAAVAVALTVGVLLGLMAGYRGGLADAVLSRVADMQLSVPGVVLAIFILTFLGGGLRNVVVVIALESWPLHYRVVRTLTIGTRNRAYVEAARTVGLGQLTILRRHILPAVLPSLAVTATSNFVMAVLTEASLSFLGLGVQPPTPDWGFMISDGRTLIVSAWWISVFPGIGLFLLLLAVQLYGDGLAKSLSLQSLRR